MEFLWNAYGTTPKQQAGSTPSTPLQMAWSSTRAGPPRGRVAQAGIADFQVCYIAGLETCATLGQHALAEDAGTYGAVRVHNGI